MRTVEIIYGGETVTLELRERAEVKVRHRKALMTAALIAQPTMKKLAREDGTIDESKAADLTPADMQVMLDFQVAAIPAVLAGWSLKLPVPTTVDEVEDLPAMLYDTLAEVVSADAAMLVAAETDFEPSSPSAPGFAETPTPGSLPSSEPSRDTLAEASTSRLPSVGESSDFVVGSPV